MSDPSDLLDQLERATAELHRAAAAAIQFARAAAADTAARSTDPIDWQRLPRPGERCPHCHQSRTSITRKGHTGLEARPGRIRLKRLGGATYYSGADARDLLAS